MKKKLLSAVLSATLTLTAFAAVPACTLAEGTAPDSNTLAENAQTKNYWIFYKDLDTTEIDRIVAEKSHDYEYSLYETESDSRTIEKLVTDYRQKLRLDMVKEAVAEKSAEVLSELGVDASNAWCSQFTSTIVCPLTDEQYEKAKAMDIITDINIYETLSLEPLTDLKDALAGKEEILNKCTRDNEGKSVCDDNVKFDVVLNAGKNKDTDYLIVYGITKNDDLYDIKKQLSSGEYSWDIPTMELYSGVELDGFHGSQQLPIKAVLFVEDTISGYFSEPTIADMNVKYGFDVAPYIVCSGDSNGDGKINAVDASSALSIYAEVQSNKDKSYTADQLKHLDVDGSEAVTAVDASHILSYYAYTSTGGNAMLKDFLKS